jgi:hypothetical protein
MKGRARDLTRVDTVYLVKPMGARKMRVIQGRQSGQTKRGGRRCHEAERCARAVSDRFAGLDHDQGDWVMLSCARLFADAGSNRGGRQRGG